MSRESLIVPLYHVQRTAKSSRDGFPYFAFHDSISELWERKWRPPCSKQIYPFTDADVDDFDPIFQRLVQIANDEPDVLYDPDEYARPFLPVAKRLTSDAEPAARRGDARAARDLYLRAAAVFRIARFPINRSKMSQEAWELGVAAYTNAGRYLDPPSLPVEIPFLEADTALGDRAVPIPAYLRIPNGAAPRDGWPVLLFICGLDAYRTDHTPRTQAHVDHGFATLSFEIPGTGDCPASSADPLAPDRLMSSILSWVEDSAATYGFDTTKIVARGISTGGYYAMRIAHTHAERLLGVVAQGGACHHVFDGPWIRAQDQMEYPFALAEALAYKFGFRGDDPVAAYEGCAKKFSLLETGILDRSSCRLLVVNGMEDSIFPIEDSVLVGLGDRNTDLIVRANRGHMGNPGAEPLVYGWLDDVIAETRET